MLQPLMMNLDYAKGTVVATDSITALRMQTSASPRIPFKQSGNERVQMDASAGQRIQFKPSGRPAN